MTVDDTLMTPVLSASLERALGEIGREKATGKIEIDFKDGVLKSARIMTVLAA